MERGKILRRARPWLLWTIVLVGAALVLKLKILAPPQVDITRVESRDLTAQVYGNGTVEAKVMVGISSKITGRIADLYADQGDQVSKGQLLARLENDDFIQQQRQAQAVLSKTNASLKVEEATLRKAIATLSLAEKNSQRFSSLANKGLVSHLESEQYQIACTVAKEEVARSQATLHAIGMEAEASQASLDLARSRLADTQIYAPQDGMIISRDLEQGSTVTPGLSIFSLADPQLVWVKANVDEALLSGVAIGKQATISLRSSPDLRLPGQVARLGRQSDRITEELEVDVAFTPPLASFRLGEQADILIVSDSKSAVPSLPTLTLVAKGGVRGVWRVSQGHLQFTKVQVGIEDRLGMVEIVSGLSPGDQVALAPPLEMAKFTDGMKVRGK
jgi:HlyD family secretion protein